MVATCVVVYNKCYTQQHAQCPNVLSEYKDLWRNVETMVIVFAHLVVWTDGQKS